MPKALAVDHVQIAMSRGQEQLARTFYAGVLGLEEIPKPAHLAARGGVWFRCGALQVHLGVEEDFRPAKKAHPAFVVDDLASFAESLRGPSHQPEIEQVAGSRRLFTEDPFGNRIELVQFHESTMPVEPSEKANMPERLLEGGCQCGAVRYRVSGRPAIAALCHCSMCRRANAAPAVGWAMFDATQVSFTAQLPTIYESSQGSRRGFCARCGTQVSFTADYIPGLIDITIGSLDDPSQVAPTLHYWESKRLPWLHLADQLPRYPEFPPTE